MFDIRPLFVDHCPMYIYDKDDSHYSVLIKLDDYFVIFVSSDRAIKVNEPIWWDSLSHVNLLKTSEVLGSVDVSISSNFEGVLIQSESKDFHTDFMYKIQRIKDNSPQPTRLLNEPTDKESLIVDKVEPVSLHEFFMSGPIEYMIKDTYGEHLRIGTSKIGFNVEVELFIKLSVQVGREGKELRNFMRDIHVGKHLTEHTTINNINIHYDTEENLQKFCSHIKELQPKAEKLTVDQIQLLDSIFYAMWEMVEELGWPNGLTVCVIRALRVVNESLLTEIIEMGLDSSLSAIIPYILNDPNDYDVLKHISKAIERLSND